MVCPSEASVNTHVNVTISVARRRADPGYVGMSSFLVTMNLDIYFQMASSTPMCMGWEVDNSHKNGVAYNVNGVCTQRKQSSTCHGLMTVLSRGQLCRRCHIISASVTTTQSDEERAEILQRKSRLLQAMRWIKLRSMIWWINCSLMPTTNY